MHATYVKQQEQQKIAPVLNDEKAVKHDSKIMSCLALPSPKANKSLEIKMFPLIFKSLHGLQLQSHILSNITHKQL